MNKELVKNEEKMAESYRDNVPVMTPRVDIFENEQEILLHADLPGVTEDGLSITLEKNELSIHAKRTIDDPPGSILAAGYREGDYQRNFSVPHGIDSEKVAAELKDGVLHVHLPKSDNLKPRKIQVKCG